jgi:hypothetical protein
MKLVFHWKSKRKEYPILKLNELKIFEIQKYTVRKHAKNSYLPLQKTMIWSPSLDAISDIKHHLYRMILVGSGSRPDPECPHKGLGTYNGYPIDLKRLAILKNSISGPGPRGHQKGIFW